MIKQSISTTLKLKAFGKAIGQTAGAASLYTAITDTSGPFAGNISMVPSINTMVKKRFLQSVNFGKALFK